MMHVLCGDQCATFHSSWFTCRVSIAWMIRSMLASQGFLVAGGGARDAELGLSPPHDGFVGGQILDR
eukprot:COSAG01_NODE_1156_length_11478_cov_3.862642_12_plen_67_part_00